MFRHRVTSLAILVVLSLFVQNAVAHITNGNNGIDPKNSVEVIPLTSKIDEMRATASCSFTIEGHNTRDDYHRHYANWYGIVYVHPLDESPPPEGPFHIIKIKTRAISGNGKWAPKPIAVARSVAPGECFVANADSSGKIWTAGQITYDAEKNALTERETYCNNKFGAAPPAKKLKSEIQEIDYIDLADNLRSRIESARAINPDIDTAFYYGGRIQTLALNDNTVYVCESYTLSSSPELVSDHLSDNLSDGVSIVELDPLAGVEYLSPTAPPKLKPRRILTTTWASVKQK